jgi:membrane protein
MGSRWLRGLSLSELGSRVWRKSNEDNVFGAAAALAYCFLLSLFPLLIFLASLVGFLPGLRESLLAGLATAMPTDAMRVVNQALADVVGKRNRGILWLGAIGGLWAASNGVVVLIRTLNIAHEVKERRPYWRVWLIAIALTIGLSVFVVAGAILIMFGDWLSLGISRFLGLESSMTFLWRLMDYFIGLGLLLIGLEGAYYFAPDTNQDWQWITPGSACALIVAVAGSLLFSLYLRFVPSYSATYGSLGAVIVLLLWLYLIGLAVLIGGEINGSLEKTAGNKLHAEQSPSRASSELPLS